MLDRTTVPLEPIADAQTADTRAAPPPRRPAAEAADTPGNVRRVSLAMAIALVLMALFNSDELRRWSRDLPESAASDRVVIAAEGWHAAMLALGPARVRPAVRSVFEAIRAVRW